MTHPLLMVDDDAGYLIQRSVRLRQAASAYFNRLFGTPTDGKKFTWSGWVKKSDVRTGVTGSSYVLSIPYSTGAVGLTISINGSNQIGYINWDGSSVYQYVYTNAEFRDPASHCHVVFSFDSTQAIASNRLLIYVNRIRQPLTIPNPIALNDVSLNNVGTRYSCYAQGASSKYFDGLLSDVNFIDGQALSPDDFGAFDSVVTNWWRPKAYAGTYGANGFHLEFKDNSTLTSSANVGLGKDTSGNGNYWTTNNISTTPGVTYDSMTDVPTLTSSTASNFAVLNPFSNPNVALFSLSDGNLSYGCNSSAGNAPRMSVLSSIAMPSGKWYWEVKESTFSNSFLGITSGLITGGTALGSQYVAIANGSVAATAATYSGTTPTFTSGDVMGFAFDKGALTLAIYKNGTLLGTFSGIESSVASWFTLGAVYTGASATYSFWNFGQQPFAYPPPSGFVALNTYNLPDSAINQGNKVMDVSLWTGTNVARNITNAAPFQPDFVLITPRSAADHRILYDSIRGVRKQLYTNLTTVEETETQGLTSFNSSGFSLGAAHTVRGQTNDSGVTYSGLQWQAGQGVTNTNTNGSIPSITSVNAAAGISLVSYSGNQIAGATVGHGLGIAPKFGIIKAIGVATSWPVYHASLGAANWLTLNSPNAYTTSVQEFNNIDPTSSVFTIGNASSNSNQSTNYIAYWFAEIAGFSKFERYQGNSSADGIFIYTGFKVKALMLKCDNASVDWFIEDSARSPYNVASEMIAANLASAESNGTYLIDFLSNGFKIRTANGNINSSANNYIYAAFAENPMKYANAR